MLTLIGLISFLVENHIAFAFGRAAPVVQTELQELLHSKRVGIRDISVKIDRVNTGLHQILVLVGKYRNRKYQIIRGTWAYNNARYLHIRWNWECVVQRKRVPINETSRQPIINWCLPGIPEFCPDVGLFCKTEIKKSGFCYIEVSTQLPLGRSLGLLNGGYRCLGRIFSRHSGSGGNGDLLLASSPQLPGGPPQCYGCNSEYESKKNEKRIRDLEPKTEERRPELGSLILSMFGIVVFFICICRGLILGWERGARLRGWCYLITGSLALLYSTIGFLLGWDIWSLSSSIGFG